MTATFDAFVTASHRHPLLSKAQEIQLARDVQRSLQPDATPKQRRIGKRAQDRLMLSNQRLVAKGVIKFRQRLVGPTLSDEDLFQAGMLGLHRATEKFDPERGYAFSTYAFLWIEQSIRREIEVAGNTIRRPTSALQILQRHRYWKGTIDEFCDRWNYSRERVEKELHHARRADAVSMDQRVNKGDDSSSSLGELIAAEDQSEPDSDEYSEAISHLRQTCGDSLSLLELQVDGAKTRDLAELQGVSVNQLKQQLQRARDEVRANTPTAVVAMMRGEQEQRSTVAVIAPPKPTPLPVMETSNGHREVEQLEKLISEVQTAEAEPQAKPQRPRRPRRTKAQIEADRAAKAPAAIKLVIGGVAVEASAADAVTLIKALGDAA